MENQIAYGFDSAPAAYRFLNALKHWSVADVKAKLHRNDATVLVSYHYTSGGFDGTSSALDDLASSQGGTEISL